MLSMLQGRPGHYLLLLIAGLVLFINHLGSATLWDLDEGRNATAALEMKEAGDFIVPTFNAKLRVDKPILMYWLQVACYQAFGINEFAVRLPSALAALGTLLSCYELGRALFRPSTGLLGALLLGSTCLMLGAGHFANPDALLNFFIVSMLTLFWLGRNNPSSSWFFRMGILLGLGALTKGPVGVVLPALVVLVFLAWERKLALLGDRRIWWGVLAILAVTLPWYIWVAVETHGTFLLGFFWTHNLNRYLSPMDAHNGSPLYYVLVLLVGMAPWTIPMLVGLWYGGWSMVRLPHPMHRGWWQSAGEFALTGNDHSLPAYRFLGAWLGCYVIFFGLAATKLPNYLLPVTIPLALLTARFFDRWRLGEIRPSRRVISICLAGMAGFGIAIGLGLACVSGKFLFKALAGASLENLEALALFGLIPVAAALAGLWFLRHQRPNGVILCLYLGTLLFLPPMIAWALPTWNNIKAPRNLVDQIGLANRSLDIRLGGYRTEHLPSLNFYTQREVIHHETEEESLAFLRYQVPVYLFMPTKTWEKMKEKAPVNCRLVAHHPDLYRLSDIVVVTNFP